MQAQRLEQLLASGGIALPPGSDVEVTGGDPVLAARFPIGETAAAALVACGAQAAHLWSTRGGTQQTVRVDVRAAAASLNSFLFVRVDGQAYARLNANNPAVALYRCRDGRWIHLHGGFPHLKAGTLAVLDCADDAASIAAAVATWDAQGLEDALAARGMCGAMARTAGEWRAHPQAKALAPLPVVEVIKTDDSAPQTLDPAPRPLSGVRVLELTRILAGPACGRALAEHGADVLRITSPHLPTLDLFDIDTGHGKRSAHLDLETPDDAARLRALIAEADVFIDGYRQGALTRRGFGEGEVRAVRPGIIHVAINCYGHAGPWATRPGWEQLAQTVTGIAAAQGDPEQPRLVPAAACDYTTGYLAAYGVISALARRASEGGSWRVRASLCQTAMWIERQGATCDPVLAAGVGDVRDLMTESATPYGTVAHLRPAVELSATPARWDLPTAPLGSNTADWTGS